MNRPWKRIDVKIGFTIMSLFLIIIVPMSLITERILTSYNVQQEHRKTNELAIHLITMMSAGDNINLDAISTMAEFTQVHVFVLDPEGKLAAKSKHHHGIGFTFLTAANLEQLRQGHPLDTEMRLNKENYIVAGLPMMIEDRFRGAVIVASSLQTVEEFIAEVRQVLLLSTLGLIVIAIGFTYLLSRKMSKPLLQMASATRHIAAGKLNTRVPVHSDDEIGVLARSINELAVELKHYRDSRNEFIANISHELKTPITYLEGYAQVIEEELYESEEEKKRYLAIIGSEARRLDRIIHDLFDLSKMEEGQISMKLEHVDIRLITAYAVEKVLRLATEKGLNLEVEAGDPPLFVWGDPVRLEQLLLNLLDNAIRYTKQGSIHVSILPSEAQVQIHIRDTGQGIPEAELPYIFERFYRVEKSRSREHGGSGLGLAIAAKLTALHGGTLRAESLIEQGTTFIVMLPRSQPSDLVTIATGH
ncbi:HAMP domain-containing histidine kinase [Paenibacillus sp. ACRRX]|uniref:sensor histidine kinase n=1 Tax=Paenibacillus sp. ACRRX TaxID=2918206 RepID=UPI001EF65DD5|nr:HAMP domain-containing sensor histidine kinase [Paenibacillus sp. ACRRX]MCG7407347.1 HAMP domain-containing histidine kinase [Paenibacillus sp. ACRRX]